MDSEKVKVALYAAVAENGVIGRDGGLPWRLSSDLKRFKADTMGRPIIMGRRTWESLPRHPLPGRRNIVMTGNPAFAAEGAQVVGSFEAAVRAAAASGADEAAVIGGASVFAEGMKLADRLHITHVLADVAGDTYFPEISQDEWRVVESQDFAAGERDTHPTRYTIYERKPV